MFISLERRVVDAGGASAKLVEVDHPHPHEQEDEEHGRRQQPVKAAMRAAVSRKAARTVM
jgi:hypothetical protein